MLGFIVGTVCLIGLVKVLRRGRGRWGGSWSGGGRRGRRPFGRGMRAFYWLFERLETTPGQEKAIRDAGEGVFQNVEGLKDEASQFKKDLARAVREDSFDQSALDEAFARQDERLSALRASLSQAFGSVHEVLDEGQRRRLAEILHEGGRWQHHGPYRAKGAF